MILSAEKISKSYGIKPLLLGVDLYLDDHDKMGIIGANGTGKSTFLKILAGKEFADSGEIIRNKNAKISYLNQETEINSQNSVLEYVLEENKAHHIVIQEYEAKDILGKLGILEIDKPVCNLSGGQKKRVEIARTLITKSELLILDEPTNHLDQDSILWLEQYLIKYNGAILMITHDRYFLNRVTNKIVEIERGSLEKYDGNYENYLETKASRQESLLSSERKRQSILKKELAWMQQGIKARGTRSKGRVIRYEELKNKSGIELKEKVEISSVTSRLGRKIININNISKSFMDEKLFSAFQYTVLREDRIGIIGNNGCGKSTLLRIICGKETTDTGEIEVGETVKIGYFAQENEMLNPEMKVIDFIKNIAEIIVTYEGTITASQMLERFLFPKDLQQNLIKRLSGGEKRRLQLLGVLMDAPNVLLLDEPTNDLDIETLTILEDYIDNFKGAVMAVSHDRYFLDRIGEKVFAFEEGTINIYNGTYTDYLDRIEAKTKDIIIKKEKLEKPKVEKSQTKKKISFKEKHEYETIDEDIEKIQILLKENEKQISHALTDHMKLSILTQEKEKLEKDLEMKTERWIYLTELFEEIEGI